MMIFVRTPEEKWLTPLMSREPPVGLAKGVHSMPPALWKKTIARVNPKRIDSAIRTKAIEFLAEFTDDPEELDELGIDHFKE